jgi:hypothetical protein
MTENDRTVEKITEEFVSFAETMEELHLLRRVAQDLRSYRLMIRLKKYD